MLVRPGTFRNHTSPALKAWVDTLRTFHANGYDGFILDASDISTLNQVSTGTTPVTAVTQPIGLIFDKHAPGLTTSVMPTPEVYNSTIDQTSVPITATSTVASNFGISFSSALVVGKMYKAAVSWSGNTSGLTIFADSLAVGNFGNAVSGTGSYYFVAVSTVAYIAALNAPSAGISFTIDSYEFQIVSGNHAIQATAAARPTWQVDANGYHYAQLLGTDDSLSCATGGGGSTGFLFCAALKPTGGAGTLRTIFSDVGTNTGYKVQLDTNNKLSFSAGNNTAFTTKVSTATVDVGTTYLLTCWDDGTNMNVQINAVSAETVARPVVVAGTAGYTLGKDNGAASSFAIVDAYRKSYIKNWAGTAAQLTAIQSWVKAGAGL